MAQTSVTSLLAGTALAASDVLPFVDISDTTQSPSGSLLKITMTNFFATVPAPIIVTSASANALAVGANGSTNPALLVDASTASSATGLKIKSAAAAGGLAVSVISSGSNENLKIDAKGTGTITLGGTSTGGITLTRAVTCLSSLDLSGQLTSNGNAVFNAAAHFSTSQLGFFGALGGTQPTVTGSRGGNAALASLLTALAGLGLLVDSTS